MATDKPKAAEDDGNDKIGTDPVTGAPAGTPDLPTTAERDAAVDEPGNDGPEHEVGYLGTSPGPRDDGLSQANPLVMNQGQE